MDIQFRNVLVVDDCESTRHRLVKDLSAIGYIVETASNGVEALKLVEQKSYDYLLTDWNMPNMDGVTLCRCLRSSRRDQYLYIIMMTSHSTSIDVVAGVHAGADDFIVKPIDARELSARMLAGSRVLTLDRNLTALATHDPLTGALNRRTYVSGISSKIEICRRQGIPLSCILLDVDHLRKINDKYRQPGGDQVLIAVAEVLKRQFRNSDFVFRPEGDKFAIILSGSDEVGAAACAERCRREIEETVFPSFEGMRVTVSCGIAEIDGYAISPMELTDRADLALRLAKKMGRNQTVCFSACEAKDLTSVGHVENQAFPSSVPAISLDN